MDKEWNRNLDELQGVLMTMPIATEEDEALVRAMLRIVELLGQLEPITEAAPAAESTGGG